ncbi:MAG TPA: DUF5916 domain-containing protein, partial [Longimicrobiales bacterium]|nr:DUF5916 domain-containing protein [Longimicrobiales bacterium]
MAGSDHAPVVRNPGAGSVGAVDRIVPRTVELHMPLPYWLLLEATVASAAAVLTPADPFPVPRISGPIAIDGVPDEPAWQEIAPLPMVGFAPSPGAEPSERTVIRLAYDERYLYVAAELGIRDGSPPAVNTFTRDRWANDDLVEIVIDSYHDRQTAVIFSVNPAGTRIDAQVTNDGEATYGFPVDASWNAFWDAAARRTPGGWSVEMRVPFSSLRFQVRDGRVTMGVIVRRFIARTNETVTFPALDPRWRLGYNKPSQAREVTFEGITPARPVYISPYALAGVQRSTGATVVGEGTRSMREVGGDLRFAPAANLNVDLTINTDFAQVEADDQQVNLTRFDLFLPEKRQFFLERAGLFDFRTGRSNRLFYTRRIGVAGTDRVRITGGGRAVGRIAAWETGALVMRTASSDAGPAETFGVGRVRVRALNDASYVGGILTTRSGGATSDVTWGVDGQFRIDMRRVLAASIARSGSSDGSHDSAAGSVTLEDGNRDGLGYRFTLSHAGAGFDPGVGFVPRNDYREADGQLTWGIVRGAGSRVLRWGPLAEATYLVRHTTGEMETAQLSAGGEVEFRSGAMVRGGIVRTLDRLDVPFAIHDDIVVRAGRHTFTWGRMFAMTAPAPALATSVFAQVGGYFDGRIASATLSPRLRLAPFVELSSDLEAFRITLPLREQVFDGSVIRLRG